LQCQYLFSQTNNSDKLVFGPYHAEAIGNGPGHKGSFNGLPPTEPNESWTVCAWVKSHEAYSASALVVGFGDGLDFEENPQTYFDWASGILPTQNNMHTPSNGTAVSSAFDQVKITWNDISNDTGYVIERYDNFQFVEIGSTDANATVFTDKELAGSTLYIYRISGKNNIGKSLPSVTTSALTLPTPGT